MASEIEWVSVRSRDGRIPIGAVGFIGDEIVTIVAFFEDKDWDYNGNLDAKERFFSLFTLKGKALADVASRAVEDPDILMRDPAIKRMQGSLLQSFAGTLIAEGMYKTYLSALVGQASGTLAGIATQNAVKSFVVKKGMEKAVEAAYRKAIGAA